MRSLSPSVLPLVGRLCAQIAVALQRFEPQGFHWTWDWDMKRVPQVVRSKLHHLQGERRAMAARLADAYEVALQAMATLPEAVLHADLNASQPQAISLGIQGYEPLVLRRPAGAAVV